jgi:small GTP-binding protein
MTAPSAPPSSHVEKLRQLRNARRYTHLKESSQKSHLILDTHTYLSVHVDPILSKAITYMLIEQPSEDYLHDLIVSYFTQLSKGVTPATTSMVGRKIKSSDRLFMAKAMAPVFSKLMNLLLAARPAPEDILKFIVSATTEMRDGAKAAAEAAALEAEVAANEKLMAAAAATAAAAAPPAAAKPAPNYPKKMTVLCVGIDGAGKSTFLQTVKGNEDPKCKPTVGFECVNLKLETTTVSFYDLGGGVKIRGIWDSYYHDVHAVMYFVDAACDDMKWKETVEVAKATLGHSYLSGKPLLVFGNKKEEKAARDSDEIKEDLQIDTPPGGNRRVAMVTIHPQKNATPGTIDAEIDSGLEWLLENIAGDFENIKTRMAEDVEKEKAREIKEKEEKDRRVMKKSLCKAFGKGGEAQEDVFSKEDGEEFLAQETGFMKAEELDAEGCEVAAMVNYQKLALMMVGGMKAPISSKKKKWTWPEIKAYVEGVLAEITE